MNLLRATQQSIPTSGKNPKKFGLVIVDMLAKGESEMSYPHSSRDQLDLGFERVGRLISFAVQHDIPIIFVVYPNENFVPIKRLLDLVPNARTIPKQHYDAFSSPQFVRVMEDFGINSPIIGGFERTCCVFKTVDSAVSRHMHVWTTDEIMFGNIKCDTRMSVFLARLYYRLKTNYFNSVDDLIHAVKMEMGVGA